jgi:hypothetical protein
MAWFLYVSLPMEPLSGSQTRIGGYLEKEYGWNKPQEAYESPQFVRGKSLEDYTEPFDLIVIGDSFSNDEQTSWVNQVSIERGLSSIFLHIDHVDIASLLSHDIFLQNPPEYLVLESMEASALLRFRRVFHSLRDYVVRSHNNSKNKGVEAIITKIAPLKKIQLTREKKAVFSEKMRLGGDFIMKAGERLLFGEKASLIKRVKINCDHCFSNTKNNYFLIGKSDLNKAPNNRQFIGESIAGLARLKELVENNGRTRFFSIVFPNKISVYLPYTKYTNNSTIFVPEFLSSDIGFLNLLQHFRTAIKDMTTDVYLPNDHHAGSAGYTVAAREVLLLMQDQ